jgi:hypothetical protein
MSFGLSEHFIGKKRYNVIKSHFDLINKKGLVIISVPNKLNPPYRINKFLKNLLRMWEYGEEYPFSRKEFITIARKLGVKKINFIGDSFWKSFRFINPFLIIKKIFKIKTKIRKEKGSFLDPYISYSLVFIGSS